MQTTISFSDLAYNLEQLTVQDYVALMTKVGRRRSKHNDKTQLAREAVLLNKILIEFPDYKRQRIANLRDKLESQTITDIENNEFLHLVEESEIWAGNRLNYLVELAALKKTDYFSLVKDLGISFSNQNDA